MSLARQWTWQHSGALVSFGRRRTAPPDGEDTWNKTIFSCFCRSRKSLAFEQQTLLVKKSPAGRELVRADIRALPDQLIDVVVQCGVSGQRRGVR